MDRRAFLAAVAALSAMRQASAQQRRLPRVAVIVAQPIPNELQQAFELAMRDLGYANGKTIELEFRSAEGNPDRFATIAADLVRRRPDVIVSGGGAPSARAVMKVTTTIPIVFPASGDPIGEGLVKSLTRPGGNVTGISTLAFEVSAKRLQLLREMRPHLQRVAIIRDPNMRNRVDQIGAVEGAAKSLGIKLHELTPRKPDDYEDAFVSAKKANAEALMVLPSSAFGASRQLLVQLAAKHGLLTIWEHRQFTDVGGLMSYGPDFTDLYRSAARYVDKILKGAKPADLPVEQASRQELVVNLQAAKAQGIAIPGPMLARADHIIQ